jgi:hypothetical protein
MNIPDHISESLETIFWFKILKFYDTVRIRIRDLGIFLSQDPGWKYSGVPETVVKKMGVLCEQLFVTRSQLNTFKIENRKIFVILQLAFVFDLADRLTTKSH